MADETKNLNLMLESDIPAEWQPVDSKPIVPSVPTNPPSAGDSLPPYFRGSIAATLQHDVSLVSTGKNLRQANTPLMPLAPSGNPQNNAAIESGIIVNNKQISTATTTVSGMNFRGVWNLFTPYKIGDVVLDNISSYVAITSSVGLEPDQGHPTNWSLLGKNLNFRGIWSAPNPVIQTNNQGAANGNPTNVTFNSNVTVGNKVFVAVSVRNIGNTAHPSVSDSQGNFYTNVFTSPRIDSNQYCIFGYLATITQSGTLTVNVSYVNGGPPGNNSATIVELSGLSAFDQTGTAGQGVSSGGAYPAISLTNNGEFVIAAAFGDNGVSAPAGFSSAPSELGTMDVAWLFPFSATSNLVQFGGSFAGGGSRFVAGAITLPLSNGKYNPYDVVEFNGSMYLCTVSTSGSPISAPSSWTLFAQATGLAQVKTASYLAVSGDEGSLLSFNIAGLGTLTLPATPPDSGWYIFVQNLSASPLTVSPNGIAIDGSAGSLTLNQFSGMVIFTDGVNYFTEHDLTSLAVPSVFTFSVNSSGIGTIGLANQNAKTAWMGPVACSSPAQPTFRQPQGTDFVNLNIASASVTNTPISQSGNLRLCGAVLPAGFYRVSMYVVVTIAGAGNISMTITWNDGTASQTFSPSNISTTVQGTFAQFDIAVLSDGVHDISYAVNLI